MFYVLQNLLNFLEPRDMFWILLESQTLKRVGGYHLCLKKVIYLKLWSIWGFFLCHTKHIDLYKESPGIFHVSYESHGSS